jgi:hypothetical protein
MDTLIINFQNTIWPHISPFLIAVWPFVLFILPIFLAILVWKMRVYYMRRMFLKKQKYVLLEIKLPKEILKSPAAMELFLYALHQTGGEASPYHTAWLGKSRAFFSLEIASIDGGVHFYIYTRTGLKNYVEAALYAQYPNVEIYPADDYAQKVFFNRSEHSMFGTEFKLTKDDAYPIKTYIDYGMDRDPKEEFKIDPITPLIEFMGSLGQGEQLWVQIVVRSYKRAKKDADDPWVKGADKIVNEILSRDPKTKTTIRKTEAGFALMPDLTKTERDVIEAIQRSLSKAAFEVGIRAFYIAKKDKFNGLNISGLLGIMKQYSSQTLNGFKITNCTSFDDYPWQDFMDYRTNKSKRELLHAYKLRSFFMPPYVRTPLILNTEELATIWHLPVQVASTPTFTRINSRKAEAPNNLPV